MAGNRARAANLLRALCGGLLLAASAVAQAAACGGPVGKDFASAPAAEAGLSAARLSELLDALAAITRADSPRQAIPA